MNRFGPHMWIVPNRWSEWLHDGCNTPTPSHSRWLNLHVSRNHLGRLHSYKDSAMKAILLIPLSVYRYINAYCRFPTNHCFHHLETSGRYTQETLERNSLMGFLFGMDLGPGPQSLVKLSWWWASDAICERFANGLRGSECWNVNAYIVWICFVVNIFLNHNFTMKGCNPLRSIIQGLDSSDRKIWSNIVWWR